MKLLILTQYFPPEVGAPQNRLFELAVRLQKLGVEITVLTAMPNYPQMEIYEGYRKKNYVTESIQGITVHRSSIFVSKKKSIIHRLRNYFSFVYSSARISKKIEDTFDFLLCESPPLFLGYSAIYIAKRKKAKLIFNVSDLWPESAEKLGVVTNKTLLGFAYNLEKKLYNKSVLVTGQTQGICKDINKRFPHVQTYWLPNGVDLNFYDREKTKTAGFREKYQLPNDSFILLYAGIIGIAQGLDILFEAANQLLGQKNLVFVLMGSGPEKERLLQKKAEMHLSNILFVEAVTKTEMPGILKEVNVALVPLRKLDLFLGAIPSKIFENLAMEVPIILGVDGEARELFINEGNCGLYVEPENRDELCTAILKLATDPELVSQLGKNGRKFVFKKFNRENIALSFFEKLNTI